jgi:hypothetical protein
MKDQNFFLPFQIKARFVQKASSQHLGPVKQHHTGIEIGGVLC